MTFTQTLIILFFTSLFIPAFMLWLNRCFKKADERVPRVRKSRREVEDENRALLEAMRQLWQGIGDFEQFCREGKEESAASTIAAMKRDIKPEWRQS